MPRFAAPAAYGFPRRRGFQHSDGRRVPSPTRRLLEGWESRPPSPRSRNAPAPSRRPQGGSQKAKEKGHPPGCPSLDLTMPAISVSPFQTFSGSALKHEIPVLISFVDLHVRPSCHGAAPLPSPLLTINIADHQTTNTASHKTIITMQRKKGTRAGCPFSSHTNGLAQLEECRTLIEEVLQYLATSIWHQGAR